MVRANKTLAGGSLRKSVMRRQVDIMNREYRQARFKFQLKDIIYHDNPYYFETCNEVSRWVRGVCMFRGRGRRSEGACRGRLAELGSLQ